MITPDLQWSWKDEPEFDALTRDGAIPPDLSRAIREEGERVIARLERREWPFNEPWPDWRPDPSWQPPRISELWKPPAKSQR
jgi:hypothetical protein